MPRLGFAYQAMPKTVIRGGYGISSFFEGYSFNQRLTSSPPFTEAINQNAPIPTKTSGGTPFTVANAFSQPFGSDPNYDLYSVWPQDTQPAYIQQYNLTVEHAITNELSVSVGYHGQNGDHLDDYRNGNQLTAAQAQDLSRSAIAELPLFPRLTRLPTFALVGECGSILVTESEGRMKYNSGQLTCASERITAWNIPSTTPGQNP